MSIKSTRQQAIMDIIAKESVNTQAALLEHLEAKGIHTTQATLSRDIRNLQLVKTHDKKGRTRYETGRSASGNAKFHSLFTDGVEKVSCAGNMVVVKCAPGMANAVCAAMDALQWDSVVGTLAGDDTIFCVVRTPDEAVALCNQLNEKL